MQTAAVPRAVVDREYPISESPSKSEHHSGGISWAAVIGGAFVSASLALILLSLGTGLGFSAVSPWANAGASRATLGGAAIGWLILTQIIASAMGGYLAGRLRTKWVHVHTDEVYFRDTAHGFLVWAVGMVITAAFLTSAAATFAGGMAQRGSNAASARGEEAMLNPNAYFVDVLLRPNGAAADRNDTAERGEVERIFAHGLKEGAIPPADQTYLDQVVSARTGMSPADSEKRVSDVFASAQQAADEARRAFAHLSLWLFVALLCGAFCASYAGTIGGRQRDHVATT
jgi:hypothetical protein